MPLATFSWVLSNHLHHSTVFSYFHSSNKHEIYEARLNRICEWLCGISTILSITNIFIPFVLCWKQKKNSLVSQIFMSPYIFTIDFSLIRNYLGNLWKLSEWKCYRIIFRKSLPYIGNKSSLFSPKDDGISQRQNNLRSSK